MVLKHFCWNNLLFIKFCVINFHLLMSAMEIFYYWFLNYSNIWSFSIILLVWYSRNAIIMILCICDTQVMWLMMPWMILKFIYYANVVKQKIMICVLYTFVLRTVCNTYNSSICWNHILSRLFLNKISQLISKISHPQY